MISPDPGIGEERVQHATQPLDSIITIFDPHGAMRIRQWAPGLSVDEYCQAPDYDSDEDD